MERMTVKKVMQRMIERYKQKTEANPESEPVGRDINDDQTIFLKDTE